MGLGLSSSSDAYTAEPNQESPSTPGMMCALTSEVPILLEDLIDGLLETLRQPLPPWSPALRELKETPVSENSWIIQGIFNGRKLEQSGMGDGSGQDRLLHWSKVTWKPHEKIFSVDYYIDINNKQGILVSEMGAREVLRTSFYKILEDPVRVEFWNLRRGIRLHGPEQAQMVKTHLDYILELNEKRRIRFTPDADSIKNPGEKSIISQPIDDYLTYDQLFAALTDFPGDYPGGQIQQLSPTEAFITGPDGVEPATGTLNVQYNKELGEITKTHKKKNKINSTAYFVIYRNPLWMEMWREDANGVREHGKLWAQVGESLINGIIDKATKWF